MAQPRNTADDPPVPPEEKKKNGTVNRLYNDSHVSLGFSWTGDVNSPQPESSVG